jgi:hypothetical protein
MTPRQKELARHALGLDQTKSGRSYRNRFYAGVKHPDWHDWMCMLGAGVAGMRSTDDSAAGECLFYLTAEGAKLALEPGETLCPEDFPEAA